MNKIKKLEICLLLAALLCFCNPMGVFGADLQISCAEEANTDITLIEETQNRFDLSELRSYAAILVCLDDGEVLTSVLPDTIIYPASLSKIMTCIIALEQIEDLEKEILLPESIFDNLYNQDASMAGFWPGEYVEAIDLLYGIMLPSGGECSEGIAEYVAGSQDAFVSMMNAKAAEIGMVHTHFVNATGLPDEDHYSTVSDLSILLMYALKNEMFRDIFTCKLYSTSSTNHHPEGITFGNSMFRLREQWDVNGGKIEGGKTGYTNAAGLCLASMACINGKEYIAVTAHAEPSVDTEPGHISDAFVLYNQISSIFF